MPENVTCYPQRDVSGLITGIRLFLKQIKEKHPLPYPQEEWYYLTVTVPDVLDAYESTLKREAEKDAEIARLKIKLSRPESDYLLEKIIQLTAERDAEKRRADAAIPENPPLTREQVMTLDDLDAVWLYSWGRSTPVTVESGRCAKAMLECPPKDKSPYGSDWWFFEHKPIHTDIIEAVRHHSDC